MRLGMVGAYSMSNYGDQLYPTLLRHLIHTHVPDAELRWFAPLPGTVSGSVRVQALGDLRRGAKLDAIIVGGGDLIRSDRRIVANDQICIPTWARRRPVQRLRAGAFARRHLTMQPLPWLSRDWTEMPTALASVGVHRLEHAGDTAQVLRKVAFSWVRTEQGRQHLLGGGALDSQTRVAPDAAFALRSCLDAEKLRLEGRRLLSGAVGSREVCVVHAAPLWGWTARGVAKLIQQLAPTVVVVVALGAYSGEQIMLARAASATGALFLQGLSAFDTTAVLAAAGCIVTTSMHAAIVGATLETPVVVPGTSKTLDAFAACPEAPPLLSVKTDDLAAAVHSVFGQRLGMGDQNGVLVERTMGELLLSLGA